MIRTTCWPSIRMTICSTCPIRSCSARTNWAARSNRPPSTIIGKADLDPDLDLTLHSSSSNRPATSDVRLADDFRRARRRRDDSLDLEPPSLSDNFEGLAEVDVDLEAESSRILSPGRFEKAQRSGVRRRAAESKPAAESSELELAATSSMTRQPSSDIGLGSDVGKRQRPDWTVGARTG